MPLSPKLALFTIAATLVYLGLAVAGGGGFAQFFSHPALVCLAVVTIAMTGIALASSGNLSSGEQEDRANRWVIPVFAAIGLLLAFLPAYTDRKEWGVLDGETIRWWGLLLYVVGGGLRMWPVFILGRRFSGLVAIQQGHQLVTTGLYGMIRHPSYLGMLVNALGWALAFRSAIGVGLAILLLPPLLARIRAEERLLHMKFGGAYEAYQSRTWRLIPGLY